MLQAILLFSCNGAFGATGRKIVNHATSGDWNNRSESPVCLATSCFPPLIPIILTGSGSFTSSTVRRACRSWGTPNLRSPRGGLVRYVPELLTMTSLTNEIKQEPGRSNLLEIPPNFVVTPTFASEALELTTQRNQPNVYGSGLVMTT